MSVESVPDEQRDGMPVIERWWRVTRPHDGHVTWTPEDPSDRLYAAWEGAPVEGPFVPEAEVERLRVELTQLADEAARAVCEPRRFAENEDHRQQALGESLTRARLAARDA